MSHAMHAEQPAHERDRPAEPAHSPLPAADEAGGLPQETEALVAMFRRLVASVQQPPAPAEDAGLYQLVEAFTALRHDVKLQAKGTRALGEQAGSAIEAMTEAAQRFEQLYQRVDTWRREREDEHRLARPLARALADLDEAIDRVGAELRRARQRVVEQAATTLADRLCDDLTQQRSGWRRWLPVRADRGELRELCRVQAERTLGPILDAVEQGYQMMQDRLGSELERQQIRRVRCVGETLDPRTMRAVDTVEAGERAPGEVVEELRTGYLWGEQVLRTAEVRAVAEASD